jgi:hypothetical protein
VEIDFGEESSGLVGHLVGDSHLEDNLMHIG